MKRSLATLGITLVGLWLPIAAFAYSSNICAKAQCTEDEVGAFMVGITGACANTGDCTLEDILTVFVNVGNWVVGLIGAVVLLMYVIGGFMHLFSMGNPEWVKKGKTYMKQATVGLLIVMFSFLAIYALRGVLQYGSVAITDEGYIVCTGAATVDKPCGLNSICVEDGSCKSLCEQKHPNLVSGPEEYENFFTKIQYFACIDRNELPTSDTGNNSRWYTPSSCIPNQCPGPDQVQCCQVDYFF